MELSDNAWSIIEPLIPKPKIRSDRRGRPWKCTRLVLDGIVWILRTGAPWRYLPEHYPSYPTCHRRFQQWTADGTLRSVLVHLSALLDGGSADEAFIDGSYAGANNGGSCVGRCRAEKATKVMVLADGAGLPEVLIAASKNSRLSLMPHGSGSRWFAILYRRHSFSHGL